MNLIHLGRVHLRLPSGICQFPTDSTQHPPPHFPIIHDIKTSAFPLRLRRAKAPAFGFFLFFFPLP